jgi:hypothetical protein
MTDDHDHPTTKCRRDDRQDGELMARIVGVERIAIIPLTFGRVRLVVAAATDHFGYDDGW